MTLWGWDQGGDEADEVIVHVAWVTKGCRGGRHDSRNLEKEKRISLGKRKRREGGREGSSTS